MNELLFPCDPKPGDRFERWTWNGKQWVTIGGGLGSGFAPINSPDFVGMPTGPTPPPGSNDAKLATTSFVMNAIAAAVAGVATWNTRSGNVVMDLTDIIAADGAPINSPHFLGQPEADTAPPGTDSRIIATTEFVQQVVRDRLGNIVDSWNGRTGDVELRWEDVEQVGGAPITSPYFHGVPRAVTPPAADNSTRLATTEYVTRAFAAELHVTSWNQRTGDVVFRPSDLSAVGGAFLASPNFVGIPTAPTAPPHTHTDQLATTRYVDDAIASNPGPPGPPGQRGADGPPGAPGQGLNIVGEVPTVGDLPMTGNQTGDLYLVGPPGGPFEGWFWDGSQWVSAGTIAGAPGPAGPAGPAGPVGPLPTPVGPSGAVQFNNAGAWGGSNNLTVNSQVLARLPFSVTSAGPGFRISTESIPTQLQETVANDVSGFNLYRWTYTDGAARFYRYDNSGTFDPVPLIGITRDPPSVAFNYTAILYGFTNLGSTNLVGLTSAAGIGNSGYFAAAGYPVAFTALPTVRQDQFGYVWRETSFLRTVSTTLGLGDLPPPDILTFYPGAVADLPAPSNDLIGARATVLDALNRTGIVQGGGANRIPVFCDGTNWRSDFGD